MIWDSNNLNAPHTEREIAMIPQFSPQAVLDAIAAERASWPHAGSMHDGARHACDAISARIRAMMGV